MPYSAIARAMIRQALPTVSIADSLSLLLLLGGELRRALGDQRIVLADEGVTLAANVDDHLAALAEGIGNRPVVGDRHGLAARTILHAERVRVAAVAPGA